MSCGVTPRAGRPRSSLLQGTAFVPAVSFATSGVRPGVNAQRPPGSYAKPGERRSSACRWGDGTSGRPVHGSTVMVTAAPGGRRLPGRWLRCNVLVVQLERRGRHHESVLLHAPHVHVLDRALGAGPDVAVDDLCRKAALWALGPLHKITSHGDGVWSGRRGLGLQPIARGTRLVTTRMAVSCHRGTPHRLSSGARSSWQQHDERPSLRREVTFSTSCRSGVVAAQVASVCLRRLQTETPTSQLRALAGPPAVTTKPAVSARPASAPKALMRLSLPCTAVRLSRFVPCCDVITVPSCCSPRG